MRARGFSLLEALVTLVILSMIATVMMQSLSQVLDLRERVLRSERDARVAGLEERWFREIIAAAVADLPDGEGAFRGDADSLRFLGLESIDGGRHAVFEWQIDATVADPRLVFRHGRSVWRFENVPFSSARFRFLDGAGRWQSQWPPAEPTAPQATPDLGADPIAEVLPRAVALEMSGVLGEQLWLADIGAGAGLPLPLRVRMEGLDGSASQ